MTDMVHQPGCVSGSPVVREAPARGVDVSSLTKRYGALTVLDDISFSIAPG